MSRLFGLLCLALAWMTRIGAQRTETYSPQRDNRGQRVVSHTRIGWQVLSQVVRWECTLGLPSGTQHSVHDRRHSSFPKYQVLENIRD